MNKLCANAIGTHLLFRPMPTVELHPTVKPVHFEKILLKQCHKKSQFINKA